jgi:hypothetical protein
MTAMTKNGVTTTEANGTEQYEKFSSKVNGRYQTFYQYDYRHTNGNLFTCVAPTLAKCRAKRDKHLTNGLI